MAQLVEQWVIKTNLYHQNKILFFFSLVFLFHKRSLKLMCYMNSIGTLRSHAILQVGRVFKRSSQPVPQTMLKDEAGSKQNHRQFLVFPTTYSDLKINFGKLLQNSFRRIIQTTNWTNFFTKPPNFLKCSYISALRRTISLTSDGINTTNKAWKYHDSVIIQRKWNKN